MTLVVIAPCLGAELAHQAGVPSLRGLGPQRLSRESLALGWIFELEGLTITQLRDLEAQLARRLLGRLSFNALLFRNTAARNRELLARQGRPLAWMAPVATDVKSFFLRHGARRVQRIPELYISAPPTRSPTRWRRSRPR